MTDEEWRAGILRRIDRLESADEKMQREINEIKTSVRESKIVVENLETMQAERFRHLEEKFTTLITTVEKTQSVEMEKANKKSDEMISGIRWLGRAFWSAVIGAGVLWIVNGGLAV